MVILVFLTFLGLVSSQATGIFLDFTNTCANVTLMPIPLASTFPGYPNCVIGSTGCSKIWEDPEESLLPNDQGIPPSDLLNGYATWNTTDLFVLFETVATFNGSDTETQQIGHSSTKLAICVDNSRFNSSSCFQDVGAICAGPAGSAPLNYDFSFLLINDGHFGRVAGYDHIEVLYTSYIDANGNCNITQSYLNLTGADADFFFYTPNGANSVNQTGTGFNDNPLYNEWSTYPSLRYQTFFQIPLRLIGNSTFNDLLFIWGSTDNGVPAGDDLAPNAINGSGQVATGAVFDLQCNPVNVSQCGDGICEAGLENCVNCPQDCYGSVDASNPFFSTSSPTTDVPVRGKAKAAGGSKGKSTPTGSTTGVPTTVGPTTVAPTTYQKHKGNPNGGNNGPVAQTGKHNAQAVCCGYFQGVGDGCGPAVCNNTVFSNPTTAAPNNTHGGGKASVPSGSGKQGSSKFFRRQLPGPGPTLPGPGPTGPVATPKGKAAVPTAPVLGNYQCVNSLPYCGDGICQIAMGENCTSCPNDCGSIPSYGTVLPKGKGHGNAVRQPKPTVQTGTTGAALPSGPLNGPGGVPKFKGSGAGKAAPPQCCGATAFCSDCAGSIVCSQN